MKKDFDILETMKMIDGKIALWSFHKERLEEACHHFKFPISNWEDLWEGYTGDHKVRLLVGKNSNAIEYHKLPTDSIDVVTIDIIHTDTSDFTKHKTTNRLVYNLAIGRHSAYDDVILWNADGFVLETTIGNIVLEKNGVWYTPDLNLGQLPGVYLKWLMTTKEIKEIKVLYTDLHQYKIYCCNAVRGLYSVTLE